MHKVDRLTRIIGPMHHRWDVAEAVPPSFGESVTHGERIKVVWRSKDADTMTRFGRERDVHFLSEFVHRRYKVSFV